MKKALAYFRTSSASGVGEDKDSEARQRSAVERYAHLHNIKIVRDYYDAAVRGADPVSDRPQFAAMLKFAEKNKIDMVLIETANRFARDLVVQITGHDLLKKKGISLIPVDCPHHFTEETPTAVLVRQILGAVAEFEKTSLVEKMGKGRERKRKETGRCEGRKPAPPEAIALARSLREKNYSLEAIGKELAKNGFFVMSRVGMTKNVYRPGSVRHMLKLRK